MTRTVESAGAHAPWLTLVHGATQSSDVFDAQVPAFRDRYRLLLVDLAGHGANADVSGPYGPLEYLDGVRDALDAAGVHQTHFWGTHTGAQMGLLLAVHAPARLRSLILEGAVIPGAPHPSVTAALERARDTARREGLEAAREEWFRTAPWFAHMREHPGATRAEAHRALIGAFPGGPWLDRSAARPVALGDDQLRAINLPVLLLNGEHDVPDFIAVAERLRSLLPDVQRHTVPGGGFPLWEHPIAVNERVATFLEAVDARTS